MNDTKRTILFWNSVVAALFGGVLSLACATKVLHLEKGAFWGKNILIGTQQYGVNGDIFFLCVGLVCIAFGVAGGCFALREEGVTVEKEEKKDE